MLKFRYNSTDLPAYLLLSYEYSNYLFKINEFLSTIKFDIVVISIHLNYDSIRIWPLLVLGHRKTIRKCSEHRMVGKKSSTTTENTFIAIPWRYHKDNWCGLPDRKWKISVQWFFQAGRRLSARCSCGCCASRNE